MDRLKLRPYDGIALTGFLMLPALFTTGLSTLVGENNTAAWIALLIAFVVMLCLFLVITCLMKRYESRNIIDIASAVMGKPLAFLYGISLSTYFCFFTGVHIRESTEILKVYGLTLTPVYIIAGLILLAAVIMNFLGGHAIVKTSGLFFIVIIAGIIYIMLLGLNRYNPDNLMPLLGNGIPDTGRNGLFTASLFDSVIILFLLAPAFTNTSEMKKSGVLSLTITAAAYIFLSVCFIMMFPPSIGSGMTSGFIEMGKSIYYNHFFYRFEAVLLLVLIFSSVIQASAGLFIARKSLACIFKLQSFKAVTVICVIPVLAAIFLPANVPDLMQNYLPLARRYSVIFMAGFPVLVLIISTIKRIFKYEKA